MLKIIFPLAATLLPLLTPQAKAQPTGSPPEPLTLTQITPRAEQLTRTLRQILQRLPPDSELTAFKATLRDQETLILSRRKYSNDLMAGAVTPMEIREQLREWRAYGKTEAAQGKMLNDWGAQAEEGLASLNKERGVWLATLKHIENAVEFKTVVRPVRSAISDIEHAQRTAGQRLRMVLDLQARLSKHGSIVADHLEKVTAFRQRFSARLFAPDAPPLWQTAPDTHTDRTTALINRSFARSLSNIAAFATEKRFLVTGIGLFAALLFWGVRRFRRTIQAMGSQDPALLRASKVLNRPLALAVLFAAPLILISYRLARVGEVLLLAQLFLLPIVSLVPLFSPARRLVYFAASFFALNGVVAFFFLDLDTRTRRELLAAIFAAGIAVLGWWGRPARLWRTRMPGKSERTEILFARWALPVLACVLAANVFGFVFLAYVLRMAMLLCASFALVLWIIVRVIETSFAALIRLPRVSSLASVRSHEAALAIWVGRAVRFCAMLCWISATLQLFDIHEAALAAFAGLLDVRLGVGTLDFSLGDLLGFVGVLLFGILFANGLRFVLREEILPHRQLPRGVPDTISTSAYYLSLLLVFFLSLSAAGVELGKLTLMTGALGVGLGFGLQNIVNNFVSGLILQFERPIRVGDVLEVGNLSGEIRQIGIRASTMRTWQGAEVIIPNSTFISGQVINWTLTEPKRRVEVPVRVAYGKEPERVIKILLEIANSHSGVLRDPEPVAIFQGFGENSLDFLLMFWAEQQTHFLLRSEISIQINSALLAAGIEIPLPQRDIRLHLEDSAAFRHSA